jgi:hypothetical protein
MHDQHIYQMYSRRFTDKIVVCEGITVHDLDDELWGVARDGENEGLVPLGLASCSWTIEDKIRLSDWDLICQGISTNWWLLVEWNGSGRFEYLWQRCFSAPESGM